MAGRSTALSDSLSPLILDGAKGKSRHGLTWTGPGHCLKILFC
jgi:hypothetical protein